MNPKIIQTTFSKRAEVLNYAMWEAISHAQVTYAKDKVTKFYPKLRMKIYSLNFDATEQFSKMIEEFLPEYAAVANDFIEKRKGVLASSPPERPASNSKRLTTE